MPEKLPPLRALCAFEATARHASFTRAADELGVTQGAVSRQVAILEAFLGMRLLERSGKQVKLLPAAEIYLPLIASAFESIRHATAELTGRTDITDLLTINILPSLSNRWLIPLLDDFRRKYPQFSVRLTIGDGPVNFDISEADIAIRVTRRNDWKKFHAEPIMGEELLPVLNPRFFKSHSLEKPNDFLRLPLLQHTSRPDMWRDYLQAMGIRKPSVKHELGFEHFFMLIQAAADGLGVALIPRFLIGKELEEEKLAVAYNKPYSSPYRYYLICPKEIMDVRKIRLFRKWLLGIISAK